MTNPEPPGGADLTPFQSEFARLFFSLPESSEFLLAGGAALIVQRLTFRTTQDLDFFTRRGAGDVTIACGALESACDRRGWTSERIHDNSTFCRLLIHGTEDLIIDLAVDSAPVRPPTFTTIGPSFAPEELAGRKLLALFDRAEARDFTDVHALACRFGKPLVLSEARSLDSGLDDLHLAQSIRSMARLGDDEFPSGHTGLVELRRFFAAWADELDPE